MAILKDIISLLREESRKNTPQYIAAKSNILDLLRVITLPDSIEDNDFLVTFSNDDQMPANDDDSIHSEDSDDDEKGEFAVSSTSKVSKGKIKQKASPKKKRKLNHGNLHDHLTDIASYRKMFSKTWISLLSLNFDSSQHKIILKHLSDHVINNLTRPLLLADYLSRSYEVGGIVSVLALESLFQLILHHNLDYPKFFQSLYRLCRKATFEMKYRMKFMKLLSLSLQSTNLNAYTVAAFIKRLASLTLVIPAPSIYFCLSQIIWLLKKHPSCQVLIHRKALVSRSENCSQELTLSTSNDTTSSLVATKLDHVSKFQDSYNAKDDDLEKCGALESSLWEIELLQYHYVTGISKLAELLMDPTSTSQGIDAAYVNVGDYLDKNYTEMIEEELRGSKSRCALAYKLPVQFIPNNSIISNCFE